MIRARFAAALPATLLLLAACGASPSTDAGTTTTDSAAETGTDAVVADVPGTDVVVADTPADAPADVPTDAQPISCGSMTCGPAQYCVQGCMGGADAGGGGTGVTYHCADPPAGGCDRHSCSCFDGLCGSQPYSCGYESMGRQIRCMCA